MPDYSTDTKPTDRPDRLDLRSQSPVDDRLAAMRELFPEVFREGKIDLESLQRSLGEWVDPGKERFGFTWPGKAACMKLIQQPSVATLRPDAAGSVDFDTTQNLIIEGDNLEVLKLLQRSYHGKVKMIYIDPPYNTGNDFVYLDDFAEPLQNYLRMSGQADVKGQRLTTNSDASGRYHSNWLNMIYSRLYLARNLLRDDGVIFVSIDDTELPALRAVMNELFGEENFIGIIVWKKKTNGNNMGFIPPVHDYIVCYGRFASEDSILGFPVSKDSIERNYSNPDNDPRGPWTITDLSANHKGPHFPITNPNTGATFYPPNGRYWALGEKDVEKKIREGRIIFGRSGTGRPVQRKFLSERSSLRVKAESWWDRHGLNADGSLELSELIGEAKVFSHPKPTATISHLVNIGSRANENDIVLDFFAGSGTTGHAVMRLNAEDGGNRRFILVQLPEPLEEPKRLDDGTELRTIADICRERVRRAGQQIAVKQFGKENTPPPHVSLDIGFRSYKLAESNFRPWNGDASAILGEKQAALFPSNGLTLEQQIGLFTENVLADHTADDLLAEVLLKDGFPLTAPVEWLELGGNRVASVADGALLVCLDRSISLAAIEAMAARNPGQIVCLEAGFEGDDARKVNALQTVRARARAADATIAFKVV